MNAKAVVKRWHLALFLFVGLGMALLPPAVFGQMEPDTGSKPLTLPIDHKTAQIFQAVDQLLKEQAYAQAVKALQAILHAPQDSYVSVNRKIDGKEVQMYVSAKGEANRLLGRFYSVSGISFYASRDFICAFGYRFFFSNPSRH
jgi:hypothetical protein